MGRYAIPKIYVVEMPTPGQEYSFDVPLGTAVIELQPRDDADITMSFRKGESGPSGTAQPWTIRRPPSRPREFRDLVINVVTPIYFQSASANALEIMLFG